MRNPLSTKKGSAGAEDENILSEKSGNSEGGAAPQKGDSSARKVKVIIGLALVALFALAVLFRADFTHRQILLLRARMANDPHERVELYQKGMAMGGRPERAKKPY